MILYRMAKDRHADDLSGIGAEKGGGRWNLKGHPALYLAENRSLCILETITHCQNIKNLYNRLVLSIYIPKKRMDTINIEDLPPNWNVTPWHNYTIEEGTKWLNANKNLILKMPSAIVPEENIFMINPKHPDYNKIKIRQKEKFHPDNRLVLYP